MDDIEQLVAAYLVFAPAIGLLVILGLGLFGLFRRWDNRDPGL